VFPGKKTPEIVHFRATPFIRTFLLEVDINPVRLSARRVAVTGRGSLWSFYYAAWDRFLLRAISISGK